MSAAETVLALSPDEVESHRRGEAHASLYDLVERHGLADVLFLLRVIAEDVADGVGLTDEERAELARFGEVR
ncbi:MAG: hypothetical protein HOW73_43605 [Polyangiaceae bacterium]|nr:hypothetical protein [Polyangiaceae bacterium]